MQVAIDGPTGAGKSTISRAVAKELGFLYIDTGAMYRAIGYKAGRLGIADEDEIVRMTQKTELTIELQGGDQHILLDGEDVTDRIRTPEVSMAASRVSAIAGVRSALVELQRRIAGKSNVIMDGRDIGTVVLKDAEVKIFLTASCEVRAKRRFDEMLEKGQDADFESVLKDMQERDYNDSHRAASPLKKAEDAILCDTTDKTLEESVKMLKDYIEREFEKYVC